MPRTGVEDLTTDELMGYKPRKDVVYEKPLLQELEYTMYKRDISERFEIFRNTIRNLSDDEMFEHAHANRILLKQYRRQINTYARYLCCEASELLEKEYLERYIRPLAAATRLRYIVPNIGKAILDILICPKYIEKTKHQVDNMYENAIFYNLNNID